MSTFLFSIFFTILFPFVKLDVLQQPPSPLTSTITPAPTAIRYDHGASLESVMLEVLLFFFKKKIRIEITYFSDSAGQNQQVYLYILTKRVI